MNQNQRRKFLINYLIREHKEYKRLTVPEEAEDQDNLLRALLNVRKPFPVEPKFQRIQDEYLEEKLVERGVTDFASLSPILPDIYLWQGDITALRISAVVNSANSSMTGCYQPCHDCIDNRIHTYAGVQLRMKCFDIMDAQAAEEPAGQAKITLAYNLPCDFIIHTVGPVVKGEATKADEALLASCYRSCLTLADEKKITSLAFCCISSGAFSLPMQQAAEIAVNTVREYKAAAGSAIKVVFVVEDRSDYDIYRQLLSE